MSKQSDGGYGIGQSNASRPGKKVLNRSCDANARPRTVVVGGRRRARFVTPDLTHDLLLAVVFTCSTLYIVTTYCVGDKGNNCFPMVDWANLIGLGVGLGCKGWV